MIKDEHDDLRRTYDLGKGADCKSFSLRMPTDVSDRLMNHCKAHGRVKAWVVVRAIQEWLDRDDKRRKDRDD